MKNLISLLLVLFCGVAAFAQTAITPVVPSETVTEAGFVTADNLNGNTVKNPAGDIVLVIKNETAGSAAVVTLSVQNSSINIPGFGAVTKADIVCTLAAGENCVAGPFPTRFWNDGNSNLILSYSGTASAAIDVLALKP